MLTRRRLLKAGAAAGAAVSAPWMWTSTNARAALALIPTAKDPRFSVPVIDPTKIDKFIDPLPVPGGNWPIITAGSQTMRVVPVTTQILPSTLGLTTTCWSYRGTADYTSTFLGPTMLADTACAPLQRRDE